MKRPARQRDGGKEGVSKGKDRRRERGGRERRKEYLPYLQLYSEKMIL